MARLLRTAALVVVAATFVSADIPTCGAGKLCPSDTPCCSQYGQCGVGAYCLGGCDPLFSHSLDSCVPAPVCKTNDYKLSSLNDVQGIDKYLGDASSVNWVSSGKPVVYNNNILLTMAQDTVGTLLASTHYVWYGKISAKLTTSQGPGVVTAFIMMSDVKDEIDFEFVGTDIHTAQSNFYFQGITNYNNEKNLTVSGDTVSKTHEYSIDWQPDQLTWSIDGQTLRTLKRSDTWNATANRFDYPQSPSRIMLSLWPAGLSSNAQGTVEWAGGLINWNSPYMQNGYYYAQVSEVNVQCYDPPSGANKTGSNSYVYNNMYGTNDSVAIVDKSQILKSFYSTGEKPDYDPNAAKSSSSSKSASATGTSTTAPANTDAQTIPGMVGGGHENDNSVAVSATSGSSPQGTDTAGTAAASSAAAATATSGGGFSQGNGNTGGGSGAAGMLLEAERSVGQSIFAVIVAVVGVMVM